MQTTATASITPLLIAALAATAPAQAQSEGAAQAPAPLIDFELDPLAFAADGYSVHAGIRKGPWRFDIGAFGAEYPDFLLSNDRYRVRFGGFGLKLDYHFDDDAVGGPFVGVAASRVHHSAVHRTSGLQHDDTLHEVSLRVGYELDLLAGLYVAPWISVGHIFGSDAMTVDGDTLQAQPDVTIFPTLHLGYRL